MCREEGYGEQTALQRTLDVHLTERANQQLRVKCEEEKKPIRWNLKRPYEF